MAKKIINISKKKVAKPANKTLVVTKKKPYVPSKRGYSKYV